MYYYLAFSFLLLLPACTATKDSKMKNQLLVISAKCPGNDQCLFEGRDLFLDINIVNNQKMEIEFPLAFCQSGGPIVKLIDTRTKAETFLPTNPADWSLREKFSSIPPGGAAVMKWVITSGELQQFGHRYVDLSAEITVLATIQVNGTKVAFRGSDTMRIVSKDKL